MNKKINALLYLSVVLIWGCTWLAVSMQQHSFVPSVVSIFYRFTLAFILLFVVLLLSRRLRRISLKDHLFCMLQGCLIFGVNFYCFYIAVGYIPSGLLSVIFSMSVLFNAFNGLVFFRLRPSLNLLPACIFGLGGMLLLFWRDIFAVDLSPGLLTGIILSILGTYSFSLGNMISLRHQKQNLDVLSTTTYATGYGALMMGIIGLIQGVSFLPEFSWLYLGGLLYLSLFGSVIAFSVYFILIGRIGANKTAYSTLLSTLIALTLSTFFEGYQWYLSSIIGLIFILIGNLVMFSPTLDINKLLKKLNLA